MELPKLRLFRSQADRNLFGYTTDEKGANLPAKFAPWLECYDGKDEAGDILVTIDFPEISLVKKNGFYLARSRTGLPADKGKAH